ncbi:glucan 1,3-beta-glucosidase [Malassezia vespertilionis]|uniref:Exg1p n=1 Tax=Malassezia vespertilionis TaxID=2020962 RepID=A0A2N1JH61_9BASI|nr:glucan 1,3-beta-glucosidase [Malassezia vespertilionis]PKI85884.1 Exg1p [Malassezia vespertilionis]WFD04856.1 glucan 1,3-beta-glucosidase [Malassezia vespertilionis]
MHAKSVFAAVFLSALAVAASAGNADGVATAHDHADTRHSVRAVPHKRREERVAALQKRADALFTRDEPKLRFAYGQEKVRGVSVGGWLVIESFIVPSFYENTGDNRVIDEWSYGKHVDHDQAQRAYREHIDNFITEDDFAEIASYNLNHVRVPFPYWGIKTYNGDPYVKANQYDKLKEAATWAKKHGLSMIIELHTVPGGANPYDHGGHTDHSNWLGNEDDYGRTLEILETLASEFSKSKYSAVTGISLVNEPNGDPNEIYDFYKRGYRAVRNPDGGETNLMVIAGDAFKNPATDNFWNGKFPHGKYQNVMMDTHVYRLFDPTSIAMHQDERIGYYCGLKGGFRNANQNLYSLVGEWSPAFTDCAPELNGRFKGARYDGSFPGSTRRGSCKNRSGNANTFSNDFKKNLKKNFEAQADAYEGGVGWIMWTWKVAHHNADEWSYKAGVKNGWIPRDPTNRDFSC